MSERRPPDYTLLRLVILTLLVAFLVIVVFGPRWYACQQLSPLERMFTRGC